ncbi:uncharacterized protein LOC120937741 [Rana temporaria]|uniref:uncharacterized protein LOC120937741 n=1 Tax=Rana temporaria TaxID=8407 RepID=UPI001AACC748|nr:uncharacterized protein LOC120937741 [Rana temporaria]
MRGIDVITTHRAGAANLQETQREHVSSLSGDRADLWELCFKRLREGVVQDLERQRRKQDNLRLLNEHIELTKQLESEREKAFK